MKTNFPLPSRNAADDAAVINQLRELASAVRGVVLVLHEQDYQIAVRVDFGDHSVKLKPGTSQLPRDAELHVTALKHGIPVGFTKLRAIAGEHLGELVVDHDLIRLAMHDADCKKVGGGYQPAERLQGYFYDR